MHIELDQLIAYKDGALDVTESKMIEQKLAECEECRSRYAALEHLSASLKDYFSSYHPPKNPDCPDKSLWSRYLNGEMGLSEESRLKDHLRQCDYCFDIVSSQLVLETAATEQLHLTERLRQKASGVSNTHLSFQDRWNEFIAKLRDTFFTAPPKWAYAAAITIVIALFAGWLIKDQMPSQHGINTAKLPGESIKLSDGNYQLVLPSEQIKSGKYTGSNEQIQQWYNALAANKQSNSVVALLTPSFVEALDMLAASQKNQGLKLLIGELEAQVIKTPSLPVDGVLIDQELTKQLISKTYTLNQHLLITFLKTEGATSNARTILKIEPNR